MEIANDEKQPAEDLNNVRIATQGDTKAITSLLQNAPHTHIHADWHYPADWLGTDGFVVEDGSKKKMDSSPMTSRFFGSTLRLGGCLAVAADPPPAAWVRVAAVSESIDGQKALSAMFGAIGDYLRKTAVSQVGWLLVESWPEGWIRNLGFRHVNSIETYIKQGADVPKIKSNPDLQIRPVQPDDFETLGQIDENAYPPLWRNSGPGLALAQRHAFSFDAAELNGRVVGYQYSTMIRRGAHLSRITVDPHIQGQGVGSALLAHAFEGYRKRGVDTISLNTQLDNLGSRRLYERFGFKPSGQKFPVWVLQH